MVLDSGTMLAATFLLALGSEMAEALLSLKVELGEGVKSEAQAKLSRRKHNITLQRTHIALPAIGTLCLDLLNDYVDLVECLLDLKVRIVRRQLQLEYQPV